MPGAEMLSIRLLAGLETGNGYQSHQDAKGSFLVSILVYSKGC